MDFQILGDIWNPETIARGRPTMDEPRTELVICVENEGYAASLEKRKVYRALPDPDAAHRNLIRVVDESGEDYLFPKTMFLAVELSDSAKDAILRG